MNLLPFLTLPPDGDFRSLLSEAEIKADCPVSLTIMAYVCIRNNLLTEADSLLAKSLTIQPENPDAVFVAGLMKAASAVGPHAAWAVIRDGARDALRVAERYYGENIQKWGILEFVLAKMSSMCLMVGPDDLALSACGRLVSLYPHSANYHQNLSMAYANVGKASLALHHLIKSHEITPTSQKEAELTDLRAVLSGKKGNPHHVLMGRYPSTEEMQSDLKKVISDYVINEVDSKRFGLRLSKEHKVFTMGSCFAREISQRLRARGFHSFHLEVSEYINSTHANVAMLDWTEGRLTNEVNLKRLNDLLLPFITPEQLLREIQKTSLFIYTLGVAPCFFDKGTGEFVMPRSSALNNHTLAEVFDFRTTKVGENVANLKTIISFVRRHNPTAKFAITLSPVPLKVTFERASAVQADCLSKSTLRIAAEEVVSEDLENIIYWPSFEIVRWLGGHVGPFYGVDDGAAWHVSTAVVQMITDLFIDRLSVD